eukprot:g17701.t1
MAGEEAAADARQARRAESENDDRLGLSNDDLDEDQNYKILFDDKEPPSLRTALVRQLQFRGTQAPVDIQATLKFRAEDLRLVPRSTTELRATSQVMSYKGITFEALLDEVDTSSPATHGVRSITAKDLLAAGGFPRGRADAESVRAAACPPPQVGRFPWAVYVPRDWDCFRRAHVTTPASNRPGARAQLTVDHHFYLFRADKALTAAEKQSFRPQDPNGRVRFLWYGYEAYVLEVVEEADATLARLGLDQRELKQCYVSPDLRATQRFFVHVMTDEIATSTHDDRATAGAAASVCVRFNGADDSTVTTTHHAMHAWGSNKHARAGDVDAEEYDLASDETLFSLRNLAPSDVELPGLAFGLAYLSTASSKWHDLQRRHYSYLLSDYQRKSVGSSRRALLAHVKHRDKQAENYDSALRLALEHAADKTRLLTDADLFEWHDVLGGGWPERESERPVGDGEDARDPDARTDVSDVRTWRKVGVRCGDFPFMHFVKVPRRMEEFLEIVNAICTTPGQLAADDAGAASGGGGAAKLATPQEGPRSCSARTASANDGVKANAVAPTVTAQAGCTGCSTTTTGGAHPLAGVTAVGKAAFICYHLVRIHPFTDGNGRLGRLLATWALRREGFPLYLVRLCAAGSERERFITAVREGDIQKGRPLALAEHIASCVRELSWLLENAFE